ncbi:MAG: 2-oxoacid:acceptor oxidoreductase subunit alpha [bacterium]|nr:2-oxoacid:acceptor oxidoreductase subunit alpha [bacterium]
MRELSVLIGGQAGDGVNQAGMLVARLLARLGWRVFVDYDYPSLIRGGHNFSLIRAADRPVGVSRARIDWLLALDRATINRHAGRLRDPSRAVFDSDAGASGGLGIPLKAVAKEAGAPAIARNSILAGAFARSTGIAWDVLEKVFRAEVRHALDVNLALARRGYDLAEERERMEPPGGRPLPILTGNEACGLGLAAAGLDAYIAYPMTPSSGILHFMAQTGGNFGVTVIHPESEIAVICMALGFAYAGRRAAVGTSGGGFCLMTEGLSLSGMAEVPVVVVVGQRPGPSTGLPTYTAQTELRFVMSAGQGEFPRLVVAPGDAAEAHAMAAAALGIAWKCQVPAIILTDKAMGEGAYSLDAGPAAVPEPPLLWDGGGRYGRYRITDSGVSPLAFPGDPRATVKANSYEHDEDGITTEAPRVAAAMQEKRLRKSAILAAEARRIGGVGVYGDAAAETAVVCWGSNRWPCAEAGGNLGMRVVHVRVLEPLPVDEIRGALEGARRVICVENNATGQLAALLSARGAAADRTVLRYDGRQFLLEELEERLREAAQ